MTIYALLVALFVGVLVGLVAGVALAVAEQQKEHALRRLLEDGPQPVRPDPGEPETLGLRRLRRRA